MAERPTGHGGAHARHHHDPTLEVAELFTHTARRLRRGQVAQLAPLGLTYAQARALRLVAGAGPLRMAELAAQLEVVPRSATTMVDALEAAGLVTRHPDPGDRRSVQVALTAAGGRLLERLEAARHDSALEVFGGLDPGQRATLVGLLEALCARGACVQCCGHGEDGDPPGPGARRSRREPRGAR
ncbi:MAG TPA: MarR family transcriptional regulator [Acidimicrobiales bacterium]|nr:MarR family transcriptional regulator [Acidimicrobiales bacterium]